MKKKLSAFSMVALLVLSCLAFTSCEKDEDSQSDKIDITQIAGDWVFETADVETTINGIDFYEYQLTVKGRTEEEAEEMLVFMTELYRIYGSLSILEDGTFSAVFNDKTYEGEWNIGEPGLHLYLHHLRGKFTMEIVSLSSNKFELREEYLDIDNGINGATTEEFSIVTHTLVK